jgi:hypothetical protein
MQQAGTVYPCNPCGASSLLLPTSLALGPQLNGAVCINDSIPSLLMLLLLYRVRWLHLRRWFARWRVLPLSLLLLLHPHHHFVPSATRRYAPPPFPTSQPMTLHSLARPLVASA